MIAPLQDQVLNLTLMEESLFQKKTQSGNITFTPSGTLLVRLQHLAIHIG